MTPKPAKEDRVLCLDQLAELVRDRALGDYDFRRATGALAEDLAYVSNALCQDPDAWRLNRAFHAVHVPSLLAIMAMLDGIDDMKSVSDDEWHQINVSVHRAAQLAAAARERIERAALDKAHVELDVLAEYAHGTGPEFRKASLFERTRDGVLAASATGVQIAKSSVEATPNIVGSMKGGISSTLARVSAVSTLASNLQSTLSGALSDTVRKPVEMRLNASGKALSHGAGTGVGLGALAAVFFPPLLPVSAGAAVLVAMRAWKSEMQKARALQGEERERRIAGLEAERTAALLQLTNGASSVQMETEDLSLTLDAEKGEADALILKGKHTGRTWSDLTALEKAEAISVFAQGAGALLNILDLGR